MVVYNSPLCGYETWVITVPIVVPLERVHMVFYSVLIRNGKQRGVKDFVGGNWSKYMNSSDVIRF